MTETIDDRIRSALLNVSKVTAVQVEDSARTYDEAISKGLIKKTVYDIPLMRRISSSYDGQSRIKIAASVRTQQTY